jgi:5-methylcytosine-specific restriction endonuclease McrA
LLKEKAEVIEATKAVIRSEYLTLQIPLVIRLVYYVRIPRRISLPVSRRALLARDLYTCQYCGERGGVLTIDHVVPKHLGGEHSWENLVTACAACNHRKGGRNLAQAGMHLLSTPREPSLSARYIFAKHATDEWEPFLEGW